MECMCSPIPRSSKCLVLRIMNHLSAPQFSRTLPQAIVNRCLTTYSGEQREETPRPCMNHAALRLMAVNSTWKSAFPLTHYMARFILLRSCGTSPSASRRKRRCVRVQPSCALYSRVPGMLSVWQSGEFMCSPIPRTLNCLVLRIMNGLLALHYSTSLPRAIVNRYFAI